MGEEKPATCSFVIILNKRDARYGQIGLLENIDYMGTGEMKVRFLDGEVEIYNDMDRQRAPKDDRPFVTVHDSEIRDKLLELYGRRPSQAGSVDSVSA